MRSGRRVVMLMRILCMYTGYAVNLRRGKERILVCHSERSVILK